jgi:hypothetical protein
MNKFYIYILFIIFGLCIYLYINKKDTFNIGGQNIQNLYTSIIMMLSSCAINTNEIIDMSKPLNIRFIDKHIYLINNPTIEINIRNLSNTFKDYNIFDYNNDDTNLDNNTSNLYNSQSRSIFNVLTFEYIQHIVNERFMLNDYLNDFEDIYNILNNQDIKNGLKLLLESRGDNVTYDKIYNNAQSIYIDFSERIDLAHYRYGYHQDASIDRHLSHFLGDNKTNQLDNVKYYFELFIIPKNNFNKIVKTLDNGYTIEEYKDDNNIAYCYNWDQRTTTNFTDGFTSRDSTHPNTLKPIDDIDLETINEERMNYDGERMNEFIRSTFGGDPLGFLNEMLTNNNLIKDYTTEEEYIEIQNNYNVVLFDNTKVFHNVPSNYIGSFPRGKYKDNNNDITDTINLNNAENYYELMMNDKYYYKDSDNQLDVLNLLKCRKIYILQIIIPCNNCPGSNCNGPYRKKLDSNFECRK